ncbi:MAG: two-component regulator propeller domain-containing protein [Thermoanaerobaculia bacterium]
MPRWTAVTRVIVLFCALSAFAQEGRVGLISFRRVAIPDDVPAHLCSAIAQDAAGLLWFGTQGGLVRYDGYEFRVYRANPADATTLAGSYVRALLVASDGRLWVGTFSGGLSVFDPRTEKFTRFQVGYDRVEGLAEDRGGRIWIATTAGLDRLDPRTGRIEHLSDDRARGLLVDRGGTLWAGTRAGLQRWREGRGFEHVAPELMNEYVIRLHEDRRGRIWIGTEEHGAAVLDPRSGTLRRIAPRPADPNGLSHYWVYGFAEGPGGEMWVATFGGGVDVIDQDSLAVIDRLRHDPVLDDTIGADRVGAVFRDRSGVMWVGTWGEGLAFHDPRTRAFRSLRFSPNRPDGLTHAAAVRALEMRDGTIWVGTNGNGIDVLDRTLRRVNGFRADALSDGAITCLAQAEDGTIWVATLNSSLHVMRPGASRFEHLPAEKLAGGPIRTIAFDRDGTLWAGASEGMVRVDPSTLETRVYRRWPGAGESSPAIESIVVARDGTLWVGSDNGLYAFDPRTEKAVRIAKDPSRADALPENWVPDLMLARDGRLWVGTAGGVAVLSSWNGRVARFEPMSRKAGEALIEDDAGQVWIGPRLRIHPKPRTAREFGPSDGVMFRGFFIASRSRTRDGRLLFGSPEGLLVVDPRALPPEKSSAPIVATALRVEGSVRAGAATLRAIELSKAERSFTLDFAALEFTAPQRQVYRHRLDGLDDDWTVLGPTQHSLTYSRLPPGQYTLRVGVMNGDGSWSPRELRLPVTVLPAFYQTIAFRAFIVIVAAALLYGVYRLRVRQLRARERALEELVATRTSELQVAYAEIQEASLTDPLTRLRNRRFLEQTIDGDLEIAARGGVDRDLVILMIDLDHFKSVNDEYGHAAGDAVLVALAQLLLRTVRNSDTVVRWGGEEFLIVVRFVDRQHAAEVAEKVRAAVAAHEFVLPDGTTIRRTCSIGFAAWPFSPWARRALSWERMVDLADAALYRSKHGGRNTWTGVLLADEKVDPVRAAEAFREGNEEAGIVVLSPLPAARGEGEGEGRELA